MKKYYNSTTQEWYIEGQSMTRKLEHGVFSGVPTEEMLLEWGFEEWVEPTPTPEQMLEKAKANKISDLMTYDQSDEVNSFFLGDLQMWLTRDERTQIDESINAYEAAGATEMTKYFNGVPYTFTLALWKQMLNALIIYASEALNVTEAHKAAINAFTTIEEVEEYNFGQGYPSKLEFT